MVLPISAEIKSMLAAVAFAMFAAFAVYSISIGLDAIKHGRARSTFGLPPSLFGMPSNGTIWAELKRRRLNGDRIAWAITYLQFLVWVFVLAIILWPVKR